MNYREQRFEHTLNKYNARKDKNKNGALIDFIYTRLKISKYKFSQDCFLHHNTIDNISTKKFRASKYSIDYMTKAIQNYYPWALEEFLEVLKEYK